MKITEQDSLYDDIQDMDVREILKSINDEDMKVAAAVRECMPQIEKLVGELIMRMERGGRIFYMGAGTSGRLGILDASELPPTFGVSYDKVIGLIAGGDRAIRKAVESAEDSMTGGWDDISRFAPAKEDTVIGIAASGTTPYVIGAVKEAKRNGLLTACVTCNPGSPLAAEADIPIVAVVGPEFITGSTRMKSGTAQKMILNMISTAVMVKTGHVSGNKMVDMQLTNSKLVDRGARMIMEKAGITDYGYAESLLRCKGSVRKAVEFLKNTKDGI